MSLSDQLDFVPLTAAEIRKTLCRLWRRSNRDSLLCAAGEYAEKVRVLLASLRQQTPGIDLPPAGSQSRVQRLIERGHRQYDLGLEQHALASAFKALVIQPHHPSALILAGRASLTLGNVEAAQWFLLQARWANPARAVEVETELSYIGDIPDEMRQEFFAPPAAPSDR
jgi:hypothetical protein